MLVCAYVCSAGMCLYACCVHTRVCVSGNKVRGMLAHLCTQTWTVCIETTTAASEAYDTAELDKYEEHLCYNIRKIKPHLQVRLLLEHERPNCYLAPWQHVVYLPTQHDLHKFWL